MWTEIIASDIHVPYENKAALSCFIKAIKEIKPDGVTLNGDIGDWDTFSRHDISRSPKSHWNEEIFYNESIHQYNSMNKLLNSIDKYAPNARKRWAHGNHEMWVYDFIKGNPRARTELFDLDRRLNLKDRGYKLYPYNSFMRLGKLRVTHGIYVGQHHAKKHLLAVQHSVLYGHNHDIQMHSIVTAEGEARMGFGAGCLCDMNREWMRNRPNNWSHGFAVVYVWPNGAFQVDLIRINNGKCIVQGKEIVG